MGHLVNCFSYSYGKTENQQKENKQMIGYEADQWSIHNSDYHQQLSSRIDFNSNRVFESYDEAREYLENHSGFYYQGAVLFKSYEKKSNSKSDKIKKKMGENHEKRMAMYNAMKEYVAKNDVKNRKSVYVGCPKCGSKLHKDYIRLGSKSQNCPLCGENLFSDTVKARIEKYETDLKNMGKQFKELQKQLAEAEKTGKFDLKWCVKVECHV